MATKTQTLSSSRAGLGSVVVTDPGTGKTQIVSNVGAVQSPAAVVVTTTTFVLHPFP